MCGSLWETEAKQSKAMKGTSVVFGLIMSATCFHTHGPKALIATYSTSHLPSWEGIKITTNGLVRELDRQVSSQFGPIDLTRSGEYERESSCLHMHGYEA